MVDWFVVGLLLIVGLLVICHGIVGLFLWFFHLKIFGFCKGNYELRCCRRIIEQAFEIAKLNR